MEEIYLAYSRIEFKVVVLTQKLQTNGGEIYF